MELPLTRVEIRRLMRAHLGQQTSEALAGQTGDQYNAFIDTASLAVFAESRWLSAQRRTTVDLGAEQYKLAWPADAAVGSLLAAAITTGAGVAYTDLEKRPFPVRTDTDLEEAEGGATYDAVQGTPRYIDPRGDGLYLYPVNDSTPRKVRLHYVVRQRMTTDAQTSICDGQAIMLHAVALAWQAHGDERNADVYMAQYRERIASLRAWQNTGRRIAIDEDARMGDEPDEFAAWPRWDTSPRT